MAQATFDIELALLNPGKLWQEMESRLGTSCELEDRREQGWGLVIRPIKLCGTSFNEQLKSFISLLAGTEEMIRNCQPVFRIAAFNPNLTFTLILDDLDKIVAFGAKVELSVYPADD